MALVVKDRVKETSTSTGTGGFTLAGAVEGFQSFASALTNGDTTYYAITDAGTGDFEVGLGTYNAGVITRTTILESTNAGSTVNFGAGEKEVFITYPAEKAVYLDASNNIAVPGLVDGRDLAADGSKLDGIEAGATADQTAGEIKTAYESNSNTNAYTDAEKTKLAGIEAGADVTDATNVEAAGAVMDADIGVTVQAYDANIVSDASYVHTDNNYTTTEKNKLAGIEAGATADQTGAEIKSLYEAQANTNAYTDAEKSKLDGIEAGATADQTKADIDALGINAATLGGNNAAYFTGYTDTAVANLVASAPGTLDTLNELAAALGDDPNFATTVTNSIATKLPLTGGTMTGNVSFGDNDKAIFGAGSDLQIYHDGGNSFIDEVGTGRLYIRASDGIHLANPSNALYLSTYDTGNLVLYYNGAAKLATTNTGIDVTGTVTADGLTVAPSGDIRLGFSYTRVADADNGGGWAGGYNTYVDGSTVKHDSTGSLSAIHYNSVGVSVFTDESAAAGTTAKRRALFAANGDISFYDDLGGTAQMVWDASADALTFADNVKATFGAGSDLQIYHDGAASYIVDSGTGNLRLQGVVQVADDPSSADGRILFGDATNAYGIVHYDYSLGDFLFENTWANAAALFVFRTNSVDALTISPSGIAVTGDISLSGNIIDSDQNEIINIDINDLTVFGKHIRSEFGLWTRNGRGVTGIDATGTNLDLYANSAVKATVNSTGFNVNGNITVSGTVDGRDVAADGTKLDGIEAGATADQTITAGSGLTGGGTGNVTLSHADTSTQASVNNSGATVIQDVTLDTYGHVTSVGSTTLTAATVGAVPTGGGTFTGAINVSNAALKVGRVYSDTGTADWTNTALTVTSLGVDHEAAQTNVLRLMRDGTSGVIYAGAADFDLYRHTDSSVNPNVGLKIRLSTTETGTLYDALTLESDGTILTGSNAVWHAGNDGSGSGLDADLLDGQQGTYYYSPANPPPAAGAVGGGSDAIFWENDQVVTTNYTITNGKNAGSFGPITINSGVTVTVGAGEVWTVV